MEYRKRSKRKYYGNRNFSDGKKRKYTEQEIKMIMEHKMIDTEIAKKIKRSVNAIQIIRCKVNKMMQQKGEFQNGQAVEK